MIVEQAIEGQIIDAFRSLVPGDVYISGAWSQEPDGTVKGDETSGAVVTVSVGQRAMPDYCGGVELVEVSIPVSVQIAIGAECDSTGRELVELYGRVAAKVWRWVQDVRVGVLTELEVLSEDGQTSVFSPGGVQFVGGDPPVHSDRSKVWAIGFEFTVHGIITNKE